MKHLTVVIISVFILGGVLFYSDIFKRQEDEIKKSFDKVPTFTLSDYEGNEVSLAQFESKDVVVINSWASWCNFCVEELPDMAALQAEFGDTIAVIAINRREPLGTARAFTDEQEVTGLMTFLLDPKDSFYNSIGGFSMPETLFVDDDKNIRVHKRGPMELEEMREKVNLILDE